jgi:hypothetical protein
MAYHNQTRYQEMSNVFTCTCDYLEKFLNYRFGELTPIEETCLMATLSRQRIQTLS